MAEKDDKKKMLEELIQKRKEETGAFLNLLKAIQGNPGDKGDADAFPEDELTIDPETGSGITSEEK